MPRQNSSPRGTGADRLDFRCIGGHAGPSVEDAGALSRLFQRIQARIAVSAALL
jgi:hypothetical protein